MQHANTISRTSCSKSSAKSHPVDTHQSFFQTLVKGRPTAPPSLPSSYTARCTKTLHTPETDLSQRTPYSPPSLPSSYTARCTKTLHTPETDLSQRTPYSPLPSLVIHCMLHQDSAHTWNSTVVEMYKETAHEHGVWRWSGCCSSRLCYLRGALVVGLNIPDVNLTQHRIAKLQACSKANKATQQPAPTQRNILRNKNWHVSFCDTAGTLMSSSSSISVNRQN